MKEITEGDLARPEAAWAACSICGEHDFAAFLVDGICTYCHWREDQEQI